MEMLNGPQMRIKRFIICFFGFSIVLIVWKLHSIETDVGKWDHKEQLQLSQHQLSLIAYLFQNKIDKSLPTIYAITPTYARFVQKAELTRISQTLTLIPNIHWIVIEDSPQKTKLVTRLLNESNLIYTHLYAVTPKFEKPHGADDRSKKHRGVEQRNAGLQWIRDNLNINDHRGVVYFMDDDNTYSVKLFAEITKVQKVGVWPVGLVGGYNVEAPRVDPETGKVIGYLSGWRNNRPFAIDMAGFAINLELILSHKDVVFSYGMTHGMQESEFLDNFTTKDQLECLANKCTEVYVWHTRTVDPVLKKTIEEFET